MQVTTAWIKPVPAVGGLDHLAVQEPCINIYGQLLPGITNVTDRARYYSFYPWFVWAFDKSNIAHTDEAFEEFFRRRRLPIHPHCRTTCAQVCRTRSWTQTMVCTVDE